MVEDKEDKTESISFRLSPEMFQKLKEYADAHKESVSLFARRVVVEFLEGSHAAPSPGPAPGGQKAQELLQEIAGLPGRVRRLEEIGAALQGYVDGLSARVEEYHRSVNRFIGIVGAPMPEIPQFPAPPFPTIPAPPPWPGGRKRKRRGKDEL